MAARRPGLAAHRVRRGRHAAGLTLVELLIGMALGLLVIAATLSMFAATGRTNHSLNALAAVQESGRQALMLLERDLRATGYRGCAYGLINSLLDPSHSAYSAALYDFNQPVAGWSAAQVTVWDVPNLPWSFKQHYVRGDVLVIKSAAAPLPANIVADVATDAVSISLDDTPCAAYAGQLLLLADCSGGGDLFQNSSPRYPPADLVARAAPVAGLRPGNRPPHTAAFSRYYRPAETQLTLAQSDLYYIGRMGDAGDSDAVGLRRIRLGRGFPPLPPDPAVAAGPSCGAGAVPDEGHQEPASADEALVRGVADLRVQFGLDRTGNGHPDQYLTPAQMQGAADWDAVVALRIGLLVGADDGSAARGAGPVPVPFDPALWDYTPVSSDLPEGPPDGPLFLPPRAGVWRFFGSTVAVRNRVG